jgi:hypothetical protein
MRFISKATLLTREFLLLTAPIARRQEGTMSVNIPTEFPGRVHYRKRSGWPKRMEVGGQREKRRSTHEKRDK